MGLIAGLALLTGGPLRAADWTVEPLSTEIGPLTATLGGTADGAVFLADGRAGGASAGLLRLTPNISRSYDTGMVLALEASILAAHDALALNRSGNKVFEQVFGSLQFGLGRFEIGQTDGAAYRLAVNGPAIDPALSLADPQMTFFRDPQTGRAFAGIFAPRVQAGASSTFAKLTYYTPKIFGVQIGLSYTPSEGRNVLPFVSAGPNVDDRQNRMWEMAARYDDQFGPFTTRISGGVIMGHNERRTPGHEGLTDWAFGAEVDYPLTDEVTLTAGGAYRRSNAYVFEVNDVQAFDNTGALHLSTALSWNAWRAGFEFSDGTARALDAPTLTARALQAMLGYTINSNLQVTGGWQRFNYKRDVGTFYTGGSRIGMDAGFVHLRFKA
ncbi:MAG TPA: porin [Rhizomicrobium sp.]|nr:porin [Rhizomicrobium sp.]